MLLVRVKQFLQRLLVDFFILLKKGWLIFSFHIKGLTDQLLRLNNIKVQYNGKITTFYPNRAVMFFHLSSCFKSYSSWLEHYIIILPTTSIGTTIVAVSYLKVKSYFWKCNFPINHNVCLSVCLSVCQKKCPNFR